MSGSVVRMDQNGGSSRADARVRPTGRWPPAPPWGRPGRRPAEPAWPTGRRPGRRLAAALLAAAALGRRRSRRHRRSAVVRVTLAVAYFSDGPTSSTSISKTVRFSPSRVSYWRGLQPALHDDAHALLEGLGDVLRGLPPDRAGEEQRVAVLPLVGLLVEGARRRRDPEVRHGRTRGGEAQLRVVDEVADDGDDGLACHVRSPWLFWSDRYGRGASLPAPPTGGRGVHRASTERLSERRGGSPWCAAPTR